MAAAQEGDINLVRVLVKEFHCKPNIFNKVCSTVACSTSKDCNQHWQLQRAVLPLLAYHIRSCVAHKMFCSGKKEKRDVSSSLHWSLVDVQNVCIIVYLYSTGHGGHASDCSFQIWTSNLPCSILYQSISNLLCVYYI